MKLLRDDDMQATVFLEFTDAEIDMIIKYMELVDATTMQNAIMNAISIAMDEEE